MPDDQGAKRSRVADPLTVIGIGLLLLHRLVDRCSKAVRRPDEDFAVGSRIFERTTRDGSPADRGVPVECRVALPVTGPRTRGPTIRICHGSRVAGKGPDTFRPATDLSGAESDAALPTYNTISGRPDSIAIVAATLVISRIWR